MIADLRFILIFILIKERSNDEAKATNLLY